MYRNNSKYWGGEHAYKEALTSLKQFCGDRDAITLAHLRSIDSIHPGKTLDDLIKFAHTVRSQLLELSQIDNFPRPEVITKICDKLKYSYSLYILVHQMDSRFQLFRIVILATTILN